MARQTPTRGSGRVMRRSFVLILALLAGCAGMTSSSRLDRFETMARAYERAIRWGDYEAALALAGVEVGPDLRHLQDVRVTSYELKGSPQANNDGTEVMQVVEIRYTNVRRMSERGFIDRQRWIYSPNDERWKLLSVFPSFP